MVGFAGVAFHTIGPRRATGSERHTPVFACENNESTMTNGTDFSILDKLVEWHETLHGIDDDRRFLETWSRVLDWMNDPGTARNLLNGLREAGPSSYEQILATHQRRYLTLQEVAVATELAQGQVNGRSAREELSSSFGQATYDRVAEALELADFASSRRFAMIGCGPFPAAVLLIHDRTGVPEILGLDCDRSAVELATKVVGKYASSRVTIMHSDGDAFDYQGCDTIYIANHVVRKERVLGRIAETAGAGTRVLLRDPCGLGCLLSENGRSRLPRQFTVSGTGQDNTRFHSVHIVLDL